MQSYRFLKETIHKALIKTEGTTDSSFNEFNTVHLLKSLPGENKANYKKAPKQMTIKTRERSTAK
jgi:hypothetical protein